MTETLNKRRNYYKTLGIQQKGSREEGHKRMLSTKMNSTIDIPTLDRAVSEKEHKPFSKMAVQKGLALAKNDSERLVRHQRSLTPTMSTTDMNKEFVVEIVQDGAEDLNKDVLPSFGGSTHTKDTTEEQQAVEDNKFNIDIGEEASKMRRKFLCKLTQEKVWLTPAEKPKTHQT